MTRPAKGGGAFDKPATLRHAWPKLAGGFIASALRPGQAAGRPTEVHDFLKRALSAPAAAFTPIGICTKLCIATEEADGGALPCDGHLVHLSLFVNTLRNSARANGAELEEEE